jgi:acetylornithine deacetylase
LKFFVTFADVMTHRDFVNDAIELLKELIATPSVSRNEDKAADVMVKHILRHGYEYKREANNVWSIDPNFDATRPTLLLNAHIDTVKQVDSWSRSPYVPVVEDDFIYGLGSNDCGGGLVSLLQVYRYLTSKKQKFNVIYLASAEEEVSGANGIRRALPLLPPIDVAIVGEPTGMQPAIVEKGLMVLDVTAHGKSGHAARNEGINAIYQALDDLIWFRDYKFDKVSEFLGPTQMNVTVINAGTQHNVIPDKCDMIVDVRTNEFYDNKDVYDFICQHVHSDVKARSFHLRSSHIDASHPLVKRCVTMGMKPFGSPTLSDQALMPFPSFKLGPGESSRSHSADEFIKISEISNAIKTYIELLDGATIKL